MGFIQGAFWLAIWSIHPGHQNLDSISSWIHMITALLVKNANFFHLRKKKKKEKKIVENTEFKIWKNNMQLLSSSQFCNLGLCSARPLPTSP